MIAIYKLNGKIYKTANLEKKLKKITPDEILFKEEFDGTIFEAEKILDNWIKENINVSKEEKDDNVSKYRFTNKKTGYTITSIYDTLDNLVGVIDDINDYEKC